MLKEAMEFFQGVVKRGNTAQIVPLPGRGNDVLVVLPDGSNFARTADPSPRADRVSGLQALIDAATSLASSDAKTTFYVGEESVVAHLNDDADRLDTVQMDLPQHPQFKTIAELAARGGLEVKKAYKLLKVGLRGCVEEGFAEKFSRIDFANSASGSDGAGHGKDTFGRQVQNVVSNAVEIPEFFIASVQVFDLPELPKVAVEIAVTLDPTTRQIILEPVPGKIEQAMREARAEIVKLLCKAFPSELVVQGEPGFRSQE